MWKAIGRTYCEAWQFTKALPLLIFLMLALEGAQHVVEWLNGFYLNAEMMKQTGSDPARLSLGIIKTVAGLLLGYCIIRYLLGDGSTHYATALEATAMRRYGASLLCYVLLSAAALLLVVIVGSQLPNRMLALPLIILVGAAVRTLLSYWMVGAAVADPNATLAGSIRMARRSLIWGMAVTLIVAMPPMAAHYALSYGALGASPPVLAAMLALDSALVAFLYVLLAGSQVAIARHVTERSGQPLLVAAVPAA